MAGKSGKASRRVAQAALTGARSLDLSGLALDDLPESLGNLTNLTTLRLDDNQLTALPESLGNLTNLTTLRLDYNRLTVVPEFLGNLTNLTEFTFHGNPLISPPPEICASGTVAVLAFLRDSAAGATVPLWASKVLIVGEATVGKTSLAKQLTGGEYDPDEGQTHGVHVDPLPLPHPNVPDTTMALTLWDFGGQLEYRATQRFYLTDRSLFVLVWNARARWRDGKILAWLDVITARAPDSPILVVATHGDEPSAATLPEDLRARYPRIVGIHTVDARSKAGFDTLREAISHQSAGLPLMGAVWPKSWADAADAVRNLHGYTATAKQVWAAMAEAGVVDPDSQPAIAKALHDLGDVVFFADDRYLGQRMILHPAWLDKRITAILDSESVATARGVLTRVERDRLWEELDDPDLNDRLVRMMERFDLAYRIGDAENSEDVALVVERLGDARPPRADQLWQQTLGDSGVREIGIVYQLKSRQAGIPTWFIARQHRYTTGLHWSHGVLLHDRDPHHPAHALLVDDERDQPTITLLVRGRYPVPFLSVLAEAFENIIDERYTALVERRLVPCACKDTSGARCPHAFRLEELILEATDPDPEADHKVRCPESGRKIDAQVMLDGLRGSRISEQIDAVQHKLDKQATTLARIDARQLATLNGIRALLARRTQAGVHCPSLFAVQDLGRSGLLRRRTLRLSLWCEWPYGPDGPHPLPEDQGVYTITNLPPWLRDYVPFLHALITTLGIAAPILAPALIATGTQLNDRAKASFETADKLLNALGEPADTGDGTDPWTPLAGQGPTHRAEVAADFRALRNALHDLDPHQTWGGLSPVPRPEDHSIVYLCRNHVHDLEYPYHANYTTPHTQ